MSTLENIVSPIVRSAEEIANLVNDEIGFDAVQLGTTLLKQRDLIDPSKQSLRLKRDMQHAWDDARSLTARLVSIESARLQFGMSRAAFWRFRKRHRIALLPGHRVYIDDIVEAFEAQRCGRRRMVA